MFIKLLLKSVFIYLFTLNSHAHDPKNCDVLQNYDFSGFESWKIEVVNRSNEFGLDEDFVSKLIDKDDKELLLFLKRKTTTI